MLNSYVVSVTICFTFPNFVTSRRCGQPDNQANGELPLRLSLDVPGNDQQPPPPPTEKPRSRCCPYDFDSRLCKVVDDRVLCGYNINVGRPQSNDHEVQLGDNCRMRAGRLECGYMNGPFTNPRRPPPWYNPETGDDDDNNIIESEHDEPQHDDKDYHPLEKDISVEMLSDIKHKLKQTKVTTTVPHHKSVTRCVEISDRIVCRNM